MTSALDSHFGLAKQAAKGTPITADASFDFFFFTDGNGISPQSVILPLPQEVGSGPLTRSVKKVAVSTAGAVEFIPRASSLGHLLLGAFGDVASTVGANSNSHVFRFAANPFAQPYYTFRRRAGALGGGEVAADVKVASLALNFRAADFLRAQAGFVGIAAPEFVEDVTDWAPEDALDSSPEFLTCTGAVQLAGKTLKALSGSFVMGNVISLDEQRLVGSYTPDDAEVTSRAAMLRFVVKAERDLYEQMMYDPAQSGAWVPQILRDASLVLSFKSTEEVEAGVNYSVQVAMNGADAASGNGNIAWSVDPIALRGNRQVVMAVTGMVLADTTNAANGPVSVTLVNSKASY